MEILGRHALLFDDDALAAFVNSKEALVEWNSLLIDRYDVRHLLQVPTPPVKRRRHPSDPSSVEESQLDEDRYLDLQPSSDGFHDQENSAAEHADNGGYHNVGFSYGNTDSSADQKNSDGSGFLPPFPVPESLLQSLPPTEKLHQIMARTAIFVSEHGGQSEIVLRVKQGSNPTFGFLMPDHHLHAYFRFLVDHPEVVKSDNDTKPEDQEKKADQEHNQTNVAGGALSLLGSVYGSGEDEDGALQVGSEPKGNEHGNVLKAVNTSPDQELERPVSSRNSTGKDLAAPKHPLSTAKERVPLAKKIHNVNDVTSSTTALSKKKESEKAVSFPGSLNKPLTSTPPSASQVEPLIVEPPSDLKRVMDKIVEFILKNGKEFETVLVEQDVKNGRFPFLLPSNKYHPYYLKVLQTAQESKNAGKSLGSQKPESAGHGSGKISALSQNTDTVSGGSGSHDIPYEPDRKEKFKMVLSGTKKDAHEPTPKPAQQQCGLSVDATAAILQAARRGLRNPKLDILPKSSLDDSGLGVGSDGGPTSSFGNLSFPSQINSFTSKPVSKGEASGSLRVEFSGSVGLLGKEDNGARDMAVGKAIAKTAALAAASEADSSEACLTREQKQKAERLKRAKMFAAMIKSGAAPCVSGSLPRLSAEPPDSVISGLAGSGCKGETQGGPVQITDASNLSGGFVADIMHREREGSSVPVDVNTSDKTRMYEKKDSDDEYKERRSRMKHHLRSRRVEDDEEEEEEREHRHSRKKHRSHHSSHHNKDDRKHKKIHSSSKERESRHRHKHDSSSEEEHRYKRSRTSRKEKKMESEDESSRKLSDESNSSRRFGPTASPAASLGLINDRWEGSAPLVDARPTEPSQSTEVPDDLRAKVRAMLLATM